MFLGRAPVQEQNLDLPAEENVSLQMIASWSSVRLRILGFEAFYKMFNIQLRLRLSINQLFPVKKRRPIERWLANAQMASSETFELGSQATYRNVHRYWGHRPGAGGRFPAVPARRLGLSPSIQDFPFA